MLTPTYKFIYFYKFNSFHLYSTSILSSLNLNIINPYKTQAYGCNCRRKESCPLQNQRLTPKTIYRADVENGTNSETKFYFELTETPFKERFGNHTRDFKHKT